ncbi:hypothetical protein [Bacteroides bouchesdurhonensis]
MIGLEISINDQKPIVAASDNLVFVDLQHGYSSDRIIIKGSDILHFFTWFKGKPETGDKVLIRVIETDNVSPVVKIQSSDRDELRKRYKQLKVELREKGLI